MVPGITDGNTVDKCLHAAQKMHAEACKSSVLHSYPADAVFSVAMSLILF